MSAAAFRGALVALALLGVAEVPRAAPAAAELSFADFYQRPAGPRGLEPTAKLLALVGRPVRIVGYRVRQQRPAADAFILAPYAVETNERDDGLADDLPPAVVYVHASPTVVAALPEDGGPLAVEGILDWGALDEADGRRSWVRLKLEVAP